MKRLQLTSILLAGSVLMLGLASAAIGTPEGKNLADSGMGDLADSGMGDLADSGMDEPDGFIPQPSFTNDCANRPPGTYCIIYSDGYVWEIPDTPSGRVWDKAGYRQGKNVEVIHGKKADYYHVIGTSLVKVSAKESYESPGPDQSATQSEKGATYPDMLAQPIEEAALTIYVHDDSMSGPMLSGVWVTGQDSAGNDFEGVTDSNGTLEVTGEPGMWQFTFKKEGYETLGLSYEVNETEEAAAYLQRTRIYQERISQEQISQEQISQEQISQEQVSLTIYVHDDSMSGPLLSGVKITGQDSAGKAFEGMTDSNGALTVTGEPGMWQFTFKKEGYETLDLSYEVNETEEAAAYLQRTGVQESPGQPQ